MNALSGESANRPSQPVVMGDEGSTTVQLAVLTPAILLVLLLVIAAGRISSASLAIDEVATNAARAASIARTAGQAQSQANTTAAQVLAEQHLHCQQTTVTVNTAGFTVPVGQPATVTVAVSCVVALADLAIPGLPGSKDLTSSFASPLGPFRGRT
jgi:Flp pilus assembly protein TadG